MMAVRLYLNHIAELDRLVALEYGRVDDGQPAAGWRPVGQHVGYLHDGPGGPELGFKVLGFSRLDVESVAPAEIWGAPRFDVPVLGLTGVSAGEVIVAARALLGDRATVNRELFSTAVNASGEKTLALWLSCLQAGDGSAHFALGCTLYGLGRHREAYRHLRHYTEIAPHGAWNWCWYGKAAQALGAEWARRTSPTRARSRSSRPATSRPTRASCCARSTVGRHRLG